MFAAVVSARLDPILAPRGFPYAAGHNGVSTPGEPARHNPDGVLFHCDGVDAVGDVMARYPGWDSRLRASYGGQEIFCLDLWVLDEPEGPSWSFEIFEADVLRAAGDHATQQLATLGSASLEKWIDQLATMLDTYFRALENSPPTGG